MFKTWLVYKQIPRALYSPLIPKQKYEFDSTTNLMRPDVAPKLKE